MICVFSTLASDTANLHTSGPGGQGYGGCRWHTGANFRLECVGYGAAEAVGQQGGAAEHQGRGGGCCGKARPPPERGRSFCTECPRPQAPQHLSPYPQPHSPSFLFPLLGHRLWTFRCTDNGAGGTPHLSAPLMQKPTTHELEGAQRPGGLHCPCWAAFQSVHSEAMCRASPSTLPWNMPQGTEG